MNIYFEDIFCESCTPVNYKAPPDYFQINLLSLREGLLNLYIIFKPQFFYEIAALYLRFYLLILSIIIGNFKGVIAVGWWHFSMSLKRLRFQMKLL